MKFQLLGLSFENSFLCKMILYGSTTNLYGWNLKSSFGSNSILWKIEQTRTSFFEHWTNSNMFNYWWLNSSIPFLASNERTSNLNMYKAFSRFARLVVEHVFSNILRTRTCSSFGNRTQTPYLWTVELQTSNLCSSTHHYQNVLGVNSPAMPW